VAKNITIQFGVAFNCLQSVWKKCRKLDGIEELKLMHGIVEILGSNFNGKLLILIKSLSENYKNH
jgi:hypothetical protein